MSNILIIFGWVLAGYFGYTGAEWYLVFVSSLLSVIGYMVARLGQMHKVLIEDGIAGFIKMFIYQMIGWSIITFTIYFIAWLFS